ncbi:MAG: hypothetical protein ACREHD_25840, partial [Pirellulales bacterium]
LQERCPNCSVDGAANRSFAYRSPVTLVLVYSATAGLVPRCSRQVADRLHAIAVVGHEPASAGLGLACHQL